MVKIRRITKVARLIRVREIVSDLRSDITDEELVEKYDLTWRQLSKVYTRLLYGGYLKKEDLKRRLEMRSGRASSHIPLAQMDHGGNGYECCICGFSSLLHFSACPRCHRINLRRIMKKPRNTTQITPPYIEAGSICDS